MPLIILAPTDARSVGAKDSAEDGVKVTMTRSQNSSRWLMGDRTSEAGSEDGRDDKVGRKKKRKIRTPIEPTPMMSNTVKRICMELMSDTGRIARTAEQEQNSRAYKTARVRAPCVTRWPTGSVAADFYSSVLYARSALGASACSDRKITRLRAMWLYCTQGHPPRSDPCLLRTIHRHAREHCVQFLLYAGLVRNISVNERQRRGFLL